MMFTKFVLLAAAVVCTAAAQEPQPAPAPVPPVPPAPRSPDSPRVKEPRPPREPVVRVHGKSLSGGSYDRGTHALDEGRWDEAREIFEAIANAKAPRADGALYWKAYSENRLGRRDDALATLASLRQQYPSSEWLNDAQALQVEIQQQAGKPVDPNAEANEELKLMAINVLINQDPERAVPLLDKILKSGGSSIRLKDRAMFVLTQSKSPQAQQLLLSMAKGGSNPDVQLRALKYMAMSGNKNVSADIAGIYSGSHDQAIKRQALNSLMIAKAVDELFNIARNEPDPNLRSEAIRDLGILHQNDKLMQLYQGGIAKDAVLENMFLLGDPARLLEILRTEKDPKLRAAAIHSLGLMHSQQAGDGLIALYSSEPDTGVKKQIVESLFIQRNAKGLVDIAKKENNLDMKRDIVQKLTMMKSKDATDYMLELLK
jgi:HEAT repeat protein